MADQEYYARSLRVIGQDVSKLKPALFEIELTGDVFVVRGTSETKPLDSFTDDEWNFRRYWHKLLQHNNTHQEADQGSSKRFELRYSSDDIDKLDKEWAALRGCVNKKSEPCTFPKIWQLPEILRTVGRFIDSERGRLVKMYREDDRLVLHVQDDRGEVKALKCSLIELCRVQARMVARRDVFDVIDTKSIWEQYDLRV